VAQVDFTTTNWGAFIGTPNQLVNNISDSLINFDNVLSQDAVSETVTPNEASLTLAGGGIMTITGVGLDDVIATVNSINYSDPLGNHLSLLGELTVNAITEDVSGTLSSIDTQFSGVGVSAVGNFVFSSVETASASITTATLKASGWTFTYGGSFSYTDFIPSGTFASFFALSPQGDTFTISDATMPVPVFNSASSIDFFLSQSVLQGNDVLTAGGKNDVFNGFAGDDILNGNAGNDVITGGAGNDSIDGGAGSDTAAYNANRAAYAITRTAPGLTITDNTGAEGIDDITSIERIRFSDGNLAFDLGVGESAGNTARIIGAAFDGPAIQQHPDYAGIGIGLFDGGSSMQQVAQLAIGTALFQSLAGSTSNEAFVNLVYENVVGTLPTDAIRNSFAGLLQGSGGTMTQADLLVLAANSDANATNIDLVGLQQTGAAFV
jgi:Ca2+-binding RTX toxin-like protein